MGSNLYSFIVLSRVWINVKIWELLLCYSVVVFWLNKLKWDKWGKRVKVWKSIWG